MSLTDTNNTRRIVWMGKPKMSSTFFLAAASEAAAAAAASTMMVVATAAASTMMVAATVAASTMMAAYSKKGKVVSCFDVANDEHCSEGRWYLLYFVWNDTECKID